MRIQGLVREVRHRWKLHGGELSRFPRAAAEALQHRALHQNFQFYEDVIGWVESAKKLPLQPSERDGREFGQPGITAYWGRDFFIDVYFWVTPEISIHNHSFSGAFALLNGRSLHCVYDFVPREGSRGRIRVGQLNLRGWKLMEPGSVHEIHSGTRFVHQVWHLSHPTVSLVIRTCQDRKHPILYRFTRSGLAIAQQTPEGGQHALTIKKAKLMRFLHRIGHPQRWDYMNKVISSASPESAYDILMRYVELWGDAEGVARLLRGMPIRNKIWLAMREALLEELSLQPRIDWERVTSEDHRFLLSVLLSARDRETCSAMIEAYSGERLEDFVITNLQSMMKSRVFSVTFPPIAYAILRGLVKGMSYSEIKRELEKDYLRREILSRSDDLEKLCRELQSLPLLKSLMTTSGNL